MARTSTARIKNESLLHRLTPDSWHDYLEHRMSDAKALLVAGLGTYIFLSLISYAPSDPSLNTAGTTDKIHNWMGQSGALTSDLLIQIFGIGAFAISAGFLAWGVRLWRKEDFGSLWLRATAILSSALLLGAAGGAIPFGCLPLTPAACSSQDAGAGRHSRRPCSAGRAAGSRRAPAAAFPYSAGIGCRA